MQPRSHLLTRAAVAAFVAAIGAVAGITACGGGGTHAAQPPGIPTLYGDGSAGALTVAASNSLLALVPSGNFQFTDLTVNAGQTLTVDSGTVIHCTGTFTVNGTLNVATGGNGGQLQNDNLFSAGTHFAQFQAPTQGVADSAAGTGEVEPLNNVTEGGLRGVGLGTSSLFLRYPGHNAGGAGAGACGDTGGSGGGGLTVLAFGALGIPGTLNANGLAGGLGGGGGAGGVVVLASATSINVGGTVNANGGNGGASDVDSGAGGGGGGGVISLLAPVIVGVNGVELVVTPGTAGTSGGAVPNAFRSGGAGGGACGGSGGSGGQVSAANVASFAASGLAGIVNKITADPTGLFP